MENLGDAYLVAPETQQSGIGHAITLYDPLRVDEISLRDNDTGYSVNGTPTDCVSIALFEILDKNLIWWFLV